MGNPQHYGIELPERCLVLLDQLWEHAAQTEGGDTPHLGPLTSTFLLSMSMPMINIPLERIERHMGKPEGAGYVDDRPLNPKAVDAFSNVIQKGMLGAAPFFEEGVWSFVQITEPPFPNIATGVPPEIAEQLGQAPAMVAARRMPASQWISILRNALAHGGIAYLDENGHSTYGTPVKMFAFVSGKYDDDGQLERVNILRISETSYYKFLTLWVSWLCDAKLARKMAA